MGRYVVQRDFNDDFNEREVVDVTCSLIEPSHVYRNTFYNDESVKYDVDKCLNRFDLNECLLDKIIQDGALSKLWMINPAFINIKMAIKIANVGKGKYLPNEYENIMEINVLRYLAGERIKDVSSDILDSAINDYNNFITSTCNKYLELCKDKEYLEEEKRALIEEDNRLNGKMEYCLDIMKDITIAKTKLLQLKK